MKNILFICMGNICRSAAAEAVMKKMIDNKGLSKEYLIDSAGTINNHQGKKADKRMIEHAYKRGYNITSISRQIKEEDFNIFDLMIVMDQDNYRDIRCFCPEEKLMGKVVYISDYFREHNDKIVPDPYYGAEEGFEYVLDLLEDGCQELLLELIKK